MKKIVLLLLLTIVSCNCYAQIPIVYYDCENATRDDYDVSAEMAINSASGITYTTSLTGACNFIGCTNAQGLQGAGIDVHGGVADGAAVAAGSWVGVAADPTTGAASYYQFNVSTAGFSGISITFDTKFGNAAAPAKLGLLVSSSSSGPWTFVASSTTLNGNTIPVRPSGAAGNNIWTTNSISLPAAANNNTTLYIRIYGYGGTGATGGAAFMSLDNVTVFATSTIAGKVFTTMDESAYYTGYTSGGTGTTITRGNFTATGAGTNVTINSSGLKLASGKTFTITSSATATFGTSGTINGTGGIFSIASGCTLATSNSGGIPGSVTTTGTNVYTAGANYIFNGATTAPFPTGTFGNPGNVTINAGSGNTVSLNLSPTLNGNLNISSGILNTSASNYNINISGNWLNNAASTAFVPNSGTVTFNGTSSQSIGGAFSSTFNNLVINNSAGAVLGRDETVNGTLTLTSGTLSIGANNLIIGPSASAVAGTLSSSNMIVANGSGQVRKQFSSNGAYLFPIGDNAGPNYTPITLSVSASSYAGSAYVGTKIVKAKHPNNANTNNYLNRYWAVTTSGLTSPSYSVTGATYVPGDVTGTEANMSMGQYPGALPWAKFSAANTSTHTLSSTAVTSTSSDFTGVTTAAPSVSSSADIAICTGGSTTLTASSGAGDPALSYSWAPAAGLSATTGTSVSASPTVTTTYTVTITDGNGFTGNATTTVTVNPVPSLSSATNDGPVCTGGSLGLHANGASNVTTYAWNGPATITNASSANASVASVTSGAAGVYTVTVNNGTGAGCSATYTTSAAVNAIPAISGITSSTNNLCVGTAFTLSAGTPSGSGTLISYNWTGPNGFSTTSSSTSTSLTPSSAAASGNYSLTVTYTGDGCTSNAAVTSSAVTVNALPTVADITPSSAILCVGNTLTFTAGAVTGAGTLTSYNWTGPNSFSATTGTNTVSTTPGSTSASGNYSVTVTYPGNGCTSTAAVTSPEVTVNALPAVASITPSTANMCVGTPLTLTAGTVSGSGTLSAYNWTGPNGYTATTTTNSVVLTPSSTAASGNYSVTVAYNGTGCTSTVAVTTTAVTVNALPTVASLTTSSNNLCIGTALTLTAGATTGNGSIVSYNWSGPNGYNTTTSVANTTLMPASTASSGDYSLSVTYTGTGCTSNAAVTSPSVTVNALPAVASIIPSTTNLCVGNLLSFTAGAVSGTGTLTSYNWTGPNSYTATTATNSVSFTPGTPAYTGDYSVTVTYTGTGCTSSAAATSPSVTVNALPTVSTITPSSNNLCVGTPLTLSASAASGSGTLVSYNWSGPNGYTAITATTSTTFTPATTAASGDYSVTVTYTGTGCTSAAAVTSPSVTVNALPTVASVAASTYNICTGAALTLTAGATTGSGSVTSYNWAGPNSYSAATSVNNATLTPNSTSASGDYSVSVTYTGTGCTSAMAVIPQSVTVNVLPTVASITPSSTNLCVGTPLTFTAGSVSGTGVLTSYNWTGPNAFSATTATGSTTFTPASTSATGDYSLTVTYPGTGCTSNAAITSPSVTVNALPTVAGITPSATTICTGATLTLNAGATTGAGTPSSYAWAGPDSYTATTTADNTSLAVATTAAGGVYSLIVTYPGTGCVSATGVSPAITANNKPVVTGITATPGVLCAGADITLNGSGASGTGSLTSYNWSGPNGYSSTTAAFSQTYTTPDASASGIYSLTVTYPGAGCTSDAVTSSAVTVNSLPVPYTVTGGGTYCAGGSGIHVGLSNSQIGVNYQLYYGSSTLGGQVAGTGTSLDFGLVTGAGSYSVRATNNSTTCVNNMSGSVTVSISVVPSVYSVTGGGNYCSGTGGVHIGLSSSDNGVGYQLYKGSTAIGGLVTGNSLALDFGIYTTDGTYTVVANPGSACAVPMSGSATVLTYPLPAVYNVTGGGAMCSGGAGVHIGLDWSVSGVNYQLYNGAATVGSPVGGTSSTLDFGLINGAGTYTVVATNATTSCVRNMAGSATVTVNPVPSSYNVTGGGTTCENSGVLSVGVDNSETGINYQLYNGATTVGSAIAGTTGVAVNFGPQNVSGTYTVLATNATTSCSAAMTGSAVININPAPGAFAVTGGGSYCAGGAGQAVGLAGSVSGIDYQLYNGATAIGSAISGNGSAIGFGSQTMAGTYTVLATNTATTCQGGMSGSVTVSINALPVANTVTGGGSYCAGSAGLPIGVSSSEAGVSYQLYNGATVMGSPVSGTGSAISFGTQTMAGTYTVLATNNTTACTNSMTGSATIIINPLPTAYNVTGGGHYCGGGAGIAIGLDNSNTGINYQLYSGASPIGGPVAGSDGSTITFGLQTGVGNYSVVAANATTVCQQNMTGSVNVAIDPLPAVYSVLGGGSYCAGGAGVDISINGSETGVNYQLYNGSATSGSAISGSGAGITFPTQTVAGTYSVLATNATTLCAIGMYGNTAVVVNPLPVAYNVTGGGAYCAGGSGVDISLDGTSTGINYQLYNGAAPAGSAIAGTGSAIDFGLKTSAGTYTVLATNATTACNNAMAGNAVVSINALPVAYNVTGGGTYCENGAGVPVGIDNSESGVNYQLYNGSTAIGSPMAGTTGSAVSFGSQTMAGTYTVLATNATTSCIKSMTGNAIVSINPAPAAYTVTGGGNICAGSSTAIGLSNSATGISYQLYRGSSIVGTTVAGTGSGISFGSQSVAGTYTVLATNNTTACTNPMAGSAVIVVNPLPTVYTVSGGGSFCVGSTGVTVGLNNSQTGVNYQLYNGATAMGDAIGGTGANISFGIQTSGGVYTVLATNTATSCTKAMFGSATVVANPLPTAYAITGGGPYCSGSTGSSVGLASSATGINYQLYVSGSAVATMSGSGSAIDFGAMYTGGTYTVLAINAATGCTANMSGSVSVSINSAPAPFTVTGGGTTCINGSGVTIGLNSSASGISYRLYRGATLVGSAVSGTGSAISFGLQTVAGTYTVQAQNPATGCTTGMTGSAVVNVVGAPTTFTVTGGGSFCPGGSGINIGLTNSELYTLYQPYLGGAAIGGPVTGTGSTLNLGLVSSAGTYSVVATNPVTGCSIAMAGTASVSLFTLPTAYSVTGGGSYCSGSGAPSIGLGNSQSGVTYKLYNGSSIAAIVAGTGSGISFGSQAAGGTYTVLATDNVTGCTNSMSGSAVVTVNSLPLVYSVSGGGSFCIGGAGFGVTLSGSNTGVNYQLYNGSVASGSAVGGTGSALNFGTFNTAGTYTVRATNATTGCVSGMTGSATIIVNPLPNVYSVNGGGSYCAGGNGVNIGLSGSDAGIAYRLFNGSSLASGPVTSPGGALSFGLQTGAGVYTVSAVNPITGCSANMSLSALVNVNPLPNINAVTGGGGYCSGGTGVHIGLDGSIGGVNYQLYNGTVPFGSSVAGTNTTLDFGLITITGTYTVKATDATTLCVSNMSGSKVVSINPLPAVYNVDGGGSYCAAGSGVNLTLSGSDIGTNYQLYNGTATVSVPVAGTGSALSFNSLTNAGIYSVSATNITAGCSVGMSGTATVNVLPLPTVFNVTGGGSYCAGSTGLNINLSGSAAGINYRLYKGGAPFGTVVSGTGSAISFGAQTVAGTYSVQAVNPLTNCSRFMNGVVTISINATPVTYNVTGGGSYCSGGAGVIVGVDGSVPGTNYTLYRDGVSTAITIAGTGTPIDFGLQTVTGIYTVSATASTTGCAAGMAGNTIVTISAPPFAYTVNGGGSYCAGGTGVAIILNGSAPGVNYQLYRGAIAAGAPMAGSGGPLNFGLQATAGHYTVMASDAVTTCFAIMNGSADVSITPLPSPFTVTGGGSFCASGAGVLVGLNGSQSGVHYYLYNGSPLPAATATGTGTTISFGMQATSGTYTVYASNPLTGCYNNMSGSAVVTANPQPLIFDIAGGGSYCAGSGGVHIGLTGSQTGVSYILYNDATVAHTPVSGTGAEVDFGLVTTVGNYSVSAVSTAGCTSDMSGGTFVAVNPLPSVFNVVGGGSYCSGVAVMLGIDGSEVGVTYKLYRSGILVGSPVPGTGSAILGVETVPGIYTIVAENATTGCIRNMPGSAALSFNAAPVAYNISSGGSYCSGGAGVDVLLEGSDVGVNYQLYNGTIAVGPSVAGTGFGINFGAQSSGVYTVRATNAATGCTAGMTGSSSITVNALPNVFSITGGGSYCPGGSGVHIGLSGSQTGVSYQLYSGSSPVGSAVTGTGAALDFGLKTAIGAYSVMASNSTTSCPRSMTGSVNVSISTLPSVFDVTGGGSYCSGGNGVHIGLSGSGTGVNYQLYKDGTAVGSSISGTGAAIDFGLKTAAGEYTVVATNPTSTCASNMSGSASVIVNALPVMHTVTGGGSYCPGGSGIGIGLLGSDVGVNYKLYTGATTSATMPGSGSDIDFGLQSSAGAYSVIATDASTACASVMSNTVTVSLYTPPASYTVTSSNSSYCQGGNGVVITLSGSATGVEYQLYYNAAADGAVIPGSGSAITFGLKTAPGIYTVIARDIATNCSATMSGSPSISINPLPAQYTVTGGGSYCAGGAGVSVGLMTSDAGINYQLYNSGTAIGGAVPGNGSPLSFGLQTAAGTYSVVAINTATLCSRLMSGTASVIVNAVPPVSSVTGGGAYCAGSAGVHVGVLSAANTAQYQLYNGSAAIGSPVTGTNGPLDFGTQTAAGVYTVRATNIANTCSSNVTGNATVTVNALPAAFAISGGGGYCAGAAGVHISLGSSTLGVNYRLYNGGTAVGSPLAGTGAAIDFGIQSAPGTYSVLATDPATTCTRSMTGATTVSVNALPDVHSVTGGGSYCAGTGGIHIGLNGSNNGVNYMLYNGSTLTTTVMGAGTDVDFGLQTTAGGYTVNAVNPATGCSRSMMGSASISITPSVVPSVTVTSSVGTNICAGLIAVYTAVQTNGGSSPVYQWKVNGSNVGFPTGSYTYFPADGDVVSVDLTSSVGCAMPATVSGSIAMTVHANVTPSVVDSVSPGDTVCSGTIVTLTAIPTFGGTAPAITWMKNGTAVGTGNTYSYVPANGDIVYSKMVSNYSCLATNNVTGNSVKITVADPVAPSVAIIANPGTRVAPGQQVKLTAIISNGGNQPTYQWLINGVAVPGATTAIFTSADFINGDSVFCLVTNNSSCGSLLSFNSVVITVTDAVGTVSACSIDAGIFPNPNNGTFTIKGAVSATSENVSIEVTDMLGQVVYRSAAILRNGQLNEHIALDRSVANGMYMVNIQAGIQHKVFHIIVKQ